MGIQFWKPSTAALSLALAALFLISTSVMAQGVTAIPDVYVISVGDELEVDILDDSEAPQLFSVGGDGNVQLPFIGRLHLASRTVAEARDLVRQTYIEREIFVSPGVELSVASFRPISVLGDVREPGNFDYQSYISAEQAVGLAGGPALPASNEEARVLERRSLEGAANSLEFDLALAAAQLARSNAQLAGEEAMDWTDLDQDLRGAINQEMFTEHMEDQNRLIAIEARDAQNRRALLVDAVTEAANRADLLDQREALLVDQRETAIAERDRVTDLVERGLIPRAQLTVARQAASQSENDLLQLQEQRSAALVQAAELKRELSLFDANRERDIRTAAQTFDNEVKKLIATRTSVNDQLRLLQQWTNAYNDMDADIRVEYLVRRRGATGVESQKIGAYDTLLPGDTLVISVAPPTGSEVMQ